MRIGRGLKFLASTFSPMINGAVRNYASAEETLFNLTSNAEIVEQWKKERLMDKTASLREEMMYHVVDVCDVDLPALNVIHVAGTKGKGSVCAMVESMLRAQGRKTGLFTSPHLISPRERIRLNGECLSEQAFSDYFFKCYDMLKGGLNEAHPKIPPFFRFLTCMALMVFERESVDVALMEVGVGGRSDSTNIVSPSVCVITRLGMDHCNVLGDTLAEIALEKAGIMKPGVPCYAHDQKSEAMAVLHDHALQVGSPLHVTRPLDASVELGLAGDHQRFNAGLAVDVVRAWNKQPQYTGGPLYASELRGLREVRWAGRSHSVRATPRVTCHIDGAHTKESMAVALRWFLGVAKGTRVLVFFCNRSKDVERLFAVLASHGGWARVIITAYQREPVSADKLRYQRGLAAQWPDEATRGSVSVADCISEAMRQAQQVEGDSVDVLMTGSLYLAGSALSHLGMTPETLFK